MINPGWKIALCVLALPWMAQARQDRQRDPLLEVTPEEIARAERTIVLLGFRTDDHGSQARFRLANPLDTSMQYWGYGLDSPSYGLEVWERGAWKNMDIGCCAFGLSNPTAQTFWFRGTTRLRPVFETEVLVDGIWVDRYLDTWRSIHPDRPLSEFEPREPWRTPAIFPLPAGRSFLFEDHSISNLESRIGVEVRTQPDVVGEMLWHEYELVSR